MRVLIAAMSMGEGGAETHVYELAKELDKRGFSVMLLSSGGALAKQLAIECPNIIIKNVLLNKRSPWLAVSYLRVLAAVCSFKPHLIHAHGRIPAAVCSFSAKLFGVPFVTTAHGIYSTSYFSKLFSVWGDRTVAVSEDIKEHLTKVYKISPVKIFLQTNGIDTKRFRPLPNEERDLIKKEFLESLGFFENFRIILSVSRLSPDAYLCAYELLEAAPRLSAAMSDAILVIVGGGTLLADLRKKAAVVNQTIGRDFVVITGHRDDIDKLANIADCFVGSARSAIEAAACGCPVIVAGGALLGRVDKTNFKECIETNFTARKRKGFDVSKLVSDILSAKKTGFEDALVEYVVEHYSVSTSCDMLMKAYNSAMREKGSVRCAIFGYYGCGNFGDNELLISMVSNLRQQIPYLRISVSSGGQKTLDDNKSDVKTINRYNPFSLLFTLLKCGVCILGSGSLLQDTTSLRSFLYYYAILKVAVLFHKPIVLYSNGIGEIKNKRNIYRLNKLSDKINLCLLRDEASRKWLLKYVPVLGKKSIVTADECVLFKPKPKVRSISKQNKNLCFIPKDVTDCDYKAVLSAINRLTKAHKLSPIIIVADAKKDAEICNRAASEVYGARVVSADDAETVCKLFEESALVISSRLHGLVFAAVSGAAPVAITDEQKLLSFMEQIGQADFVRSRNGFTTDEYFVFFEDAFERRVERKETVTNAVALLRERAKTNSALTAELIKQYYKI